MTDRIPAVGNNRKNNPKDSILYCKAHSSHVDLVGFPTNHTKTSHGGEFLFLNEFYTYSYLVEKGFHRKPSHFFSATHPELQGSL